MELASKYNPADVEGKWYHYWLDHKLFSSKPDGREPYTIVIPPPNVTGVLHTDSNSSPRWDRPCLLTTKERTTALS